MKFNTDTVLINNKQVSEYILSENNNQLDNRYYTKNEIEDKLNNKSNIDLSNLNEIGRKSFFPSDTFVTIAINDFDIQYTAPANGYVTVKGVACNPDGTYAMVYAISGTIFAISSTHLFNREISVTIPVKKGAVCRIATYNANYNGSSIAWFTYAEGEV